MIKVCRLKFAKRKTYLLVLFNPAVANNSHIAAAYHMIFAANLRGMGHTAKYLLLPTFSMEASRSMNPARLIDLIFVRLYYRRQLQASTQDLTKNNIFSITLQSCLHNVKCLVAEVLELSLPVVPRWQFLFIIIYTPASYNSTYVSTTYGKVRTVYQHVTYNNFSHFELRAYVGLCKIFARMTE